MGAWMRAAADLVLGLACAGCDAPGERLCRTCGDALRHAVAERPPDPLPAALADAGLLWISSARYDGPVVGLVHAYKEDPRPSLAVPLGRALGDAVREICERLETRTVRLVPVPSRRAAVRRRGFDAGVTLARAAAGHARRGSLDAAVLPVLRVRGRVADQAGLDASLRALNVTGRWAVRAGGAAALARAVTPRAAVVLTDDVVTTGSSVAEGVRVLARAGVTVDAVATVAATPRRATRRA